MLDLYKIVHFIRISFPKFFVINIKMMMRDWLIKMSW